MKFISGALFPRNITLNQASVIALGIPGIGFFGHGLPLPMPALLAILLATGYSRNDAVETIFLNLIYVLAFGPLSWCAIPRLTARFDEQPSRVIIITISFIVATYVLAILLLLPIVLILNRFETGAA